MIRIDARSESDLRPVTLIARIELILSQSIASRCMRNVDAIVVTLLDPPAIKEMCEQICKTTSHVDMYEIKFHRTVPR